MKSILIVLLLGASTAFASPEITCRTSIYVNGETSPRYPNVTAEYFISAGPMHLPNSIVVTACNQNGNCEKHRNGAYKSAVISDQGDASFKVFSKLLSGGFFEEENNYLPFLPLTNAEISKINEIRVITKGANYPDMTGGWFTFGLAQVVLEGDKTVNFLFDGSFDLISRCKP